MKRIQFCQQSIKLLGFITVALFVFSLFSCSTEKVKDVENPTNPSAPSEVSEDVLKKVAAATQVAGKFFHESNSISELEKHLDEIRKTEGVVDVWTDDQTMFVKYESVGLIAYYYPFFIESETQYQTRNNFGNFILKDSPINGITRSSSKDDSENEVLNHTLNTLDKHSLVIYNAFSHDPSRGFFDINKGAIELKDYIKTLYPDWEINLIDDPDHDFKVFFGNEIYQYDLVFLCCHGIYNNNYNDHSLITGQIARQDVMFTKEFLSDYCKVKLNYDNEKYITCVKEGDDINGFREVAYWAITENYINNQTEKFKQKAIVFNAACGSLKTNDIMGYIFCNKGAACYLGYNDTNCLGRLAGIDYIKKLLDGLSIQASYDNLEDKFKHDTSKYKDIYDNFKEKQCDAYLKIITQDDKEYNKYLCLTTPITDLYEELNLSVILRGSVKIANPYYKNIKYGFAIYRKGSFRAEILTPGMEYHSNVNTIKYDEQTHTMRFEFEVSKFEIEDVDRYCAYMYDGERYCLGDLKDISVENVEGQFCSDENHPHAIDLGLPSGNLWSCCNLEAKGPDDHENKGYPWGYTESVNSDIGYSEYFYKYIHKRYFNGMTYSYEYDYSYLGEDITKTKYDAAYMNSTWGGEGWAMPTKKDTEELISCCNYEVDNTIDYDYYSTRKYIVTGPNGNCITLYGPFWTSTQVPDEEKDWSAAYIFWPHINPDYLEVSFGARWKANNIRPIKRRK